MIQKKVTLQWIQKSNKKGPISVDTETTGSVYNGGMPFLVTFCNTSLEERYIFVSRNLLKIRRMFREMSHIVFHNHMFDIPMLENIGVHIPNGATVDDTMIMAHLLNEYEERKSLKYLAAKYLPGEDTDEEKNLHSAGYRGSPGKTTLGFDQAPQHLIIPYACADVRKTLKLYYLYRKPLKKGYEQIYEDEMKVSEVTMKIMRRGIKVDLPKCRKLILDCEADEEKYFRKLTKLAGKGFNPRSPKQVREVLYSKLKFPITKKTKKGTPATDVEALAEMAHPFITNLRKYRQAAKMRGTYFESFIDRHENSIIHCSFNPHGTRTGRFSSSNPNLQNIPREDPYGVRDVFICRPNYTNYFFDYSQVEMRTFAHYSKSEKLLNDIRQGIDFHTSTAQSMFGTVTPKLRFIAKCINFGILFGIGGSRLASELVKKFMQEGISGSKLTLDESIGFIQKYHRAIPSVKSLSARCQREIHHKGYIEDEFGRRYHVPKEKAYIAISALIQGTAAGIIKEAMINVDQYLSNSDCHIILTVHDELCIEIPNEDLSLDDEVIKGIVFHMTNFQRLSVPLTVDIKKTTTSWLRAKRVENIRISNGNASIL